MEDTEVLNGEKKSQSPPDNYRERYRTKNTKQRHDGSGNGMKNDDEWERCRASEERGKRKRS
jgi:hypothetical protein